MACEVVCSKLLPWTPRLAAEPIARVLTDQDLGYAADGTGKQVLGRLQRRVLGRFLDGHGGVTHGLVPPPPPPLLLGGVVLRVLGASIGARLSSIGVRGAVRGGS